jgi:putative DNA primase/helicase
MGANGKSTLTKVLMRVLGVGETGYAVAAAAEMLMIRKHSEHPAEIAKLAGARMVVCSELDDSQRFNEARIKDLTGGDMLDARFLYGQPFTFTPTHTMWLYGNKRPQAHTGGMAFWRRVKLIELEHVVPVERRDTALDDKLYAAGGTVLAWAIAGAVDYLTNGQREPGSISAATAAYAEDQDTVGRFVNDCCHRADSELVRIAVGKLRATYEAWCREVGEEPVSAKRFSVELRDRFAVGEARSNASRFFTRITLLEDPTDEPDGPEDDADRDWYR